MNSNSPVRKYWGQYKWSNVAAMIKNSMADPELYDGALSGSGSASSTSGADAGRLVVLTGATSGIGYQTARKYASRGARLLTINRNEQKSAALCEELRRDFGSTCDYWIADLSRLEEVHRIGHALAELEAPIEVLIHNAGIYLSKKVLTGDGLELTFATNYLASFVITMLVKEKLKAQQQARILLVSSEGYRFAVWGLRLDDLNWDERRYNGLGAYGAAKLAQVLSMMMFQEDFRGSGVTINTMHPGLVATNTGRDNGAVYKWFKRNTLDRISKPASVSAEALYTLGVAPALAGVSGVFFNLTRTEELTPPARDRDVAEALWDISLNLGGLR